MKTIRNMITAATLITGLSLGTVAMVAPSGAGAALAPQTAQEGAVQQFWAYMAGLESTRAECIALTESTHSTAATQYPDLYMGNCLQAFILALYSGGSIAWEYVN